MNGDTGLYYIGNFISFMSYLQDGKLAGIPAMKVERGYYQLRWGERILQDGTDVNLRELGIEDHAELTLEHVPFDRASSPGAPKLT